MRIKTNIKVGVNVGDIASRTITGATNVVQTALETSGRTLGQLIGTAGKLVTDRNFWTWPFNGGR